MRTRHRQRRLGVNSGSLGIATLVVSAFVAIVAPWHGTSAQDDVAADAVAEEAPADGATEATSEAAGPAEDLVKLQTMREEEDATLPEAIFAAVNARVSADEAAQNELVGTLVKLLKTPDGFTLKGSGSGGMSGYPGGSMPMSPPMYSPGPGDPGMSGMSGMSGPPVQQKNTTLQPIPIAVMYACVHGLFQLKAPDAGTAIQSILAGSEAVEDDRITTGLVIWEMTRRYSAPDQATLLKCIVKPTEFRKASAAPIATVGGGSGSGGMSGYPGGTPGGYPGSSPMYPGSGSTAKAEPLSAQDIQQLAATAMLLTHPTRPAQTAIAKQIVSPTCDAALRQTMLTLMNASQPMQYVTMKQTLAAEDPDAGTRASFAMMLTRSEISELPAIMGLTPTAATMFDGSGVSVSVGGGTAGQSGGGYPGGYPGSGSSSPMSPYPGSGYPGGSPQMYGSGSTYPGMGGNQTDVIAAMAKMKPGSQEYVTAALQQMFVGRLSQNTGGSSRGNEFAAAMGQILQLDPGLLVDVTQLMGSASAGEQDDPAAIFWSTDAVKSATAPLTETKSPERGPALIHLVTTPTSAARQYVWKYLKLNEAKGPGDFLAIGVGEKLMPDPSLLISVKSLANASGRRKDVPLSSAITFAIANGQPNRTGSGYPNPSMMSGTATAPGTATSEEQVKLAAQLSGRTSWAAFSDYLRHWISQRLIAEDIEGSYTRVSEKMRPYELPQDAEVLNEYRCVLPTMIPDEKKETLGNAKISIDPTYVYFVRYRCSERGTNTRISFYNSQLKKNTADGAASATETFLGTGYWLDWIGVNPKTGYPRSVDIYIRPEQNAFDKEKPLAILAPTNRNATTPYGSPMPTPGSGNRGSGSQRAVGGDPIMPGMLGNYLGAPLSNYLKAAPTALIVDVLVVECRASANPPKKSAAPAATPKKTEP